MVAVKWMWNTMLTVMASIVELSKDIHIAIIPMYVYDDGDRKKSAIEVKFTK